MVPRCGKVGPVLPGKGTGGRRQGNSGTEYMTLEEQVAQKTVQATSKVASGVVDTFERCDPARAAKLAKLLGR